MSRISKLMRVLQVAAKAFSLVNFVLPLMKRLREVGFEVEALTGSDGFEERIKAEGFRVHAWHMDHTFNPLILWGARRELAEFLAQHEYDIVHTHCSFAGIIGNPVAYSRTKTLIYTQHGFFVHEGLGRVQRRVWLEIEKVGLRWAHKVICVSQAERDLALTLGVGEPEKFFYVPGAGVRTEQFRLNEAERARRRQAIRESLNIGPRETVMLTVSRLTWDKGYKEMVEAVGRLRGEGYAFKFLAAGSGKDKAGIRRLIEDRGLSDDFLLLGWRDDVVDLYCAADIFVFASHREGLPIAPIEAMASGLPVVASDIPGCCEEIEHGKSGLLYPVRDVGALTESLRQLLDDPALCRRLGREAAKRAELFDLQRVLDLQVGLYKQLAEQL